MYGRGTHQSNGARAAAQSNEVNRVVYHLGCTCHLVHPPCTFCTEMAEEEVEVFVAGGYHALAPYVDRMTNEVYALVKEKAAS